MPAQETLHGAQAALYCQCCKVQSAARVHARSKWAGCWGTAGPFPVVSCRGTPGLFPNNSPGCWGTAGVLPHFPLQDTHTKGGKQSAAHKVWHTCQHIIMICCMPDAASRESLRTKCRGIPSEVVGGPPREGTGGGECTEPGSNTEPETVVRVVPQHSPCGELPVRVVHPDAAVREHHEDRLPCTAVAGWWRRGGGRPQRLRARC